MRRTLSIAGLALLATLAGCGTWNDMERSEKGETIGATSGAVVGAIVGGPIGAGIGGAVGGYAGHHEGKD